MTERRRISKWALLQGGAGSAGGGRSNGFGFTISGQNPCVLSNVVPESQADQAGLVPGDVLLNVNGVDVSTAGHDQVVRLIAKAKGGHLTLGLGHGLQNPRVAASKLHKLGSNEEISMVIGAGVKRAPPPLPHFAARELLPAPFHPRGGSEDSTLNCMAFSAARSGSTGGVEGGSPSRRRIPNHHHRSGESTATKRHQQPHLVDLGGAEELQLTESEIAPFLSHPSLDELRRDAKEKNLQCHATDVSRALLRVVIGYLGTIEVPSGATPSSSSEVNGGFNDESEASSLSLQAVRNCIRRLRVEKRVHTTVLMCVLPEAVVLINHQGRKVAEYPAKRIAYCGTCLDDKRFLGLVVTSEIFDPGLVRSASSSSSSSSCHVFMTDNDAGGNIDRLTLSSSVPVLAGKQQKWSTFSGLAVEFPPSAEPIMKTVMELYNGNKQLEGCLDSNPFKKHADDPSPKFGHKISSNRVTENGISKEIAAKVDQSKLLDVRAMPAPPLLVNQQNLQTCPPGPSNNSTNVSCGDRSFNTEQLESQLSADSIRQSMQKYLHNKHQHLKKVSEQLLLRRTNSSGKDYDDDDEDDEGDDADEEDDTDDGEGSSKAEATLDRLRLHNLLPSGNPLLLPRRAPSTRSSFVRSLEDLRGPPRENAGQTSFDEDDFDKVVLVAAAASSRGMSRRIEYGKNMNVNPAVPEIKDGKSKANGVSVPMLSSSSVLSGAGANRSPKVHQRPSASSLSTAFNQARSIFSSDSNLSQTAAASSDYRPNAMTLAERLVTASQKPSEPLLPSHSKGGILRPCDQYPSEPGVLKSRPLSSLSAHSNYGGGGTLGSRGGAAGHKTECSSTSGHSPRDRDCDDFVEPSSSVGVSQGKAWSRNSSSRDLFKEKSLAAADDDSAVKKKSLPGNIKLNDGSKDNGKDPQERAVDVGRVGLWATDFQNLLSDPVGLRTFTEYLKKEFSHENIYFWSACERYRQLTSVGERRLAANEIMDRHLTSGAPDPVNIDAVAKQSVLDALEQAEPGLFANAQCQIYNLMKFDSFSRFLKSDLYKESLLAGMNGRPLPLDAGAGSSGSSSSASGGANADHRVATAAVLVAPGASSSSGSSSKKHRGPEAAAGGVSSAGGRRRSLMPFGLPSSLNLRHGTDRSGGSGSSSTGGGGGRSKSKDRSDLGSSSVKEMATSESLKRKIMGGFSSEHPAIGDDAQQGGSRLSSSVGSHFFRGGGRRSSSSQMSEDSPRPTATGGDQLDTSARGSCSSSRSTSSPHQSEAFCGGGDDDDDDHDSDGTEAARGCALARVILPDKATTVVQTRSGENIRSLVARLLEKRGLRYTSFDVFVTNPSSSGGTGSSAHGVPAERPLDLSEDSVTLGCTEVRVEPRVLFRLELPSKKSIGVKAKPAKVVKDVLGPILNQYGWDLGTVTVQRDNPVADGVGRQQGGEVGSSRSVDLESTVASIDNCRLIVLEASPLVADSSGDAAAGPSSKGTLQGSLRDEDEEAERRAMPPPECLPPRLSHYQIKSSTKGPFAAAATPMPPSAHPSLSTRFEKPVAEELYEGLKIAQRGRLDDQRGTEINFEMPDFLKRVQVQQQQQQQQNKENFGPLPPSSLPMNSSLMLSDRRSLFEGRRSEPVRMPGGGGSGPPPPYHQQYPQPLPHPIRPHHQMRSSSGSTLGSRLSSHPTAASGSVHSMSSLHQFDYAMLTNPSPHHHQYQHQQQPQAVPADAVEDRLLNDSNFSADGYYMPSLQEADELFNPNGTVNHFNESRLSFGPGLAKSGVVVVGHGGRSVVDGPKDPVYETLSKYKNSRAVDDRPSLPDGSGDGQRQQQQQLRMSGILQMDPPPLPPKPRLHPQQQQQLLHLLHQGGAGPGQAGGGQYLVSGMEAGASKRPSGIYLRGDQLDDSSSSSLDERGYNVSFV